MASIKCPECGKEMESKLSICSYCGFKFEQHNTVNNINSSSYSNNNTVFVINNNEKTTRKTFRELLHNSIFTGILGFVLGVAVFMIAFNPFGGVKQNTLNNGNVTNNTAKIKDDDILTNKKNIDTNKKADNSETIVVSAKNLHPVLYDNESLFISMENCQYTEGLSDLRIELYIKNLSKEIVEIKFKNITINDANFYIDNNSPYKVGTDAYSNYYISGDDLNDANVIDFEEFNCDIECYSATNGHTIFTKSLIIHKDAFFDYQ